MKISFHCQLYAEMKTPFQQFAEMESIRWNEFARPKDAFMVARAGQFTIQKPYKYTLIEPAEPVGLAHARTRTHRCARHPAEMEISTWNNGIFISAQSWNENSIKILVAQRDHFPFHLRASVELPDIITSHIILITNNNNNNISKK